MNVVLFDGIMGAGKTMGMSIMAQNFRQKSGCTLYSNYGLRDSHLFTSFDQFTDVAQQPSSIIALDEAHSDLDARSSNTSINKYLSHVFYYLRKLRCTIFLSTPDISSIDSRIRAVTHVYFRVVKKRDHFVYYAYDLQSSKFLRQYRINKANAFKVAPQIYDTHKMVVPMNYPDTRQEYERLINLLKDENDQYYETLTARELGTQSVESAVGVKEILSI